MTPPNPYSELPPALEHLVREGGRVRPMLREERQALFRAIERRIPSNRRVSRPLVAVTCTTAVCVAAFVALVSMNSARRAAPEVAQRALVERAAPPVAPSRAVSLQGRGQLVLSPHAIATLPPGLEAFGHGAVRVRLESGRIDATVSPRGADEPFSIATPHVTVVVVGTRFSVVVEGGVTEVAVEHGRVRVEGPRGVAFVSAGESIRSDAPSFGLPATDSTPGPVPLAPEPPSVATRGLAPERTDVRARLSSPARATKPRPCTFSDLTGKHDCLTRATAASGLDGENALLSLALFERNELGDGAAAVLHLREHQRRYPNGALAPEVAWALVTTLAAGGESDAACRAADDYARRFPRDQATIERLRGRCTRK